MKTENNPNWSTINAVTLYFVSKTSKQKFRHDEKFFLNHIIKVIFNLRFFTGLNLLKFD